MGILFGKGGDIGVKKSYDICNTKPDPPAFTITGVYTDMVTYKIITDSACDLPKAMLQELDVITVPLTVNFRGETRSDSVEDAAVMELYNAMRGGEVATTAAVNPDGWSNAIEPVLAAGHDALVMAFSGGLSTTYQSAVIAANDLKESYPDRKVLVVLKHHLSVRRHRCQ